MVNVDQLSICTHKTIYDALIEFSIRWLPQAVLCVELLLIS